MRLWTGETWREVPAFVPYRGHVVVDARFTAHLPATRPVPRLPLTRHNLAQAAAYLRDEGPGGILHGVRFTLQQARQRRLLTRFGVVGRIAAVGEGVNDLAPGDPVAGYGFWGYAHAQGLHVHRRCLAKVERVDAAFAYLLHWAPAAFLAGEVTRSPAGAVRVAAGPWMDEWGDLLVHWGIRVASVHGAAAAIVCREGIVPPTDPHILPEVAIEFPDPAEETECVLDTTADGDTWFPAWANEEVHRAALRAIEEARPKLPLLPMGEDLRRPRRPGRWCVAYPEPTRTFAPLVRAARPRRPGLGLALIGVGLYSLGTLLPLLRRRMPVRPRAACDAYPDRVNDALLRLGFEVGTTDPEEVFADPEVELVVIAAYPDAHARLAVRALEAGKKVFLEKPPVLSADELAALCGAVRARRGWLAVGYNRPYAALARRAAALLAPGEPVVVQCAMESYAVPANHWYHWTKEGGRILLNVCHLVDLCHHLTGRSLPVSVVGSHGVQGRYYEDAAVTVTYENGSVAQILYTGRGNRLPGGQESLRIHHAGRTIVVEDFRRLTVHEGGRRRVVRFWWREKGHAALLAAVAGALEKGGEGLYSLYDLAVTSTTLLAADRAVREGARVSIDREALSALFRA